MKKLLLAGLCFLFAITQPVFSQPSLAFEDKVDLAIVIDKGSENVTCVKDASNPAKWYYLVTRPRLEILQKKTSDKPEIPNFSLIKYLARSRADSQKLIECVVLKATINLALPEEDINKVKNGLAKIANLSTSKIILAPLPMSSAKITIYAPDGKLMGEATTAPDIAPYFDNSSVPIQINLENTDPKFFEALIKANNGVYAAFIFDYNGITPRYNLKATIDWDHTYRHFSLSSKARSDCESLLLGNSDKKSLATMRDSLLKNKCIKVESLTGEPFKDEELDAQLMPILDIISNEIFNAEFPKKISPDKAASHGIANEVSFEPESAKIVKKGSMTYPMNRQLAASRQIIAGGKIGIGNYSKKIQEKLISIIQPGEWQLAWCSLPDVGFAEDMQLGGVNFQVSVVDDKGTSLSFIPAQVVEWSAQNGWKDRKGNRRTTLVFTLAEINEKYKGKENKLFYKQKMTLTWNIGSKRTTAAFEKTVPMFTGDVPISKSASAIKCIEINGSLLTWLGDKYSEFVPAAYAGQPSDLAAVSIVLESAKTRHHLNAALKQSTTRAYLLMNTGDTPGMPEISAKINYRSRKNKKAVTINNVIKEVGPQILLSDLDYLPEQ